MRRAGCPVREREQRASAAVVGVPSVEFLDHPDGTVESGLALREDLALAIRRHWPDTLLLFKTTATTGDSPVVATVLTTARSAKAGLDAAADAGKPLDLPDRGS